MRDSITGIEASSSNSRHDVERSLSLKRTALVYGALVILPVIGLLWMLQKGSALPAPFHSAPVAPPESIAASRIVLRTPIFLTQIIVIVAAARLLGAVLQKLGQPQVIGEMLAGLMLGPSLLGLVAPGAYAWLFPAGSVRFLNALSQTGLVLFMFLVGLELDVREIIARSRQALIVSHASIAVPMLAGVGLALVLYCDFATIGTSFPAFALFLGCAMSITAFPVLARILRESGLAQSAFGSVALGCAAVADVSAWLIFGVVVSLAREGQEGVSIPLWQTLAGITVYLAIMMTLVRRLLEFICTRARRNGAATGSLSQDQLGAVLLLVLISAVATDLLKIHAIFGAFVAGAVMPRDAQLSETIRVRLEDLLSILLLPLFFAYAGLRTNIAAMTTAADWLVCGTIIGFAVLSKVGSCILGGRATGMPWRVAGSLGVLMNARGLIELVLLTIGLQIGIITPLLYTIMVIMAVVTTVMTTPLFTRVMAFGERTAPS